MATAPRTPEGGGESFQILFDQEKDGRWIAEIPELPGVMVYAPSKADADKNWDAFQKDPDWVKVKADSEVSGVLAQKVDRTYMDPTDFSKLK